MCAPGIIKWVTTNFPPNSVKGKHVLEVGSRDVNGSVRSYYEKLAKRYTGVDIVPGPGVDSLVNVDNLAAHFKDIDVLISTEMVEHVDNWRLAFQQMFEVVKPGGTMIVSTRSKGFPLHSFPHDCWRYEVEDMRRIFEGWHSRIEVDDTDVGGPGVFVMASKPRLRVPEPKWDDIKLFSMATQAREL